jgi:C-terminal processing protease CtpA/Prc
MLAWFAKAPFRFAKDFRIRVSAAAIASNAKRLSAQTDKGDSISSKFADAYARHRIGDVFSFDIPMAQPRDGQRFGGRVFMLVNRHSYSNTVQVAAMSQDMHIATILGEETSDLATTFGAMEQFTLPRTGIDVGFPKAQIIRVNGDLRARGVVPDVLIETPIVEPASDPVLQRALQLAR